MAKKVAGPAPDPTLELERLRDLCSEVYQVAGALGASDRVLDNLWAAAAGKPIPHDTLLPYAPEQNPKSVASDKRRAARKRVASTANRKAVGRPRKTRAVSA
jgi:hypothetical protein